jgi:hypothetical protein
MMPKHDETLEEERDRTSRRSIKIPIEVVPELVGNAAAMREALVEMVNADTDGDMTLDSLCGRCIAKLHGTCKHDGSCWCEKVIAALTSPARNCDRFGGDYKMLHTAWFDWTGSPSGHLPDGTAKMTFAAWLLAPTAERKGVGDGR